MYKFSYRCKKCGHRRLFEVPISVSWMRFVQREEFVKEVCPKCKKHYVSGGGNKE